MEEGLWGRSCFVFLTYHAMICALIDDFSSRYHPDNNYILLTALINDLYQLNDYFLHDGTKQSIWLQDCLLAILLETLHHMVKTQHTSVNHYILSIHHYPICEKDLQIYCLLKHCFLFEELHIHVWNIIFVMTWLWEPLHLPFLLDLVVWHLVAPSLIYYSEWIAWPNQPF